MEILTYILEGMLEHQDTMGNHSQIGKGEFQLMTAGTGIQHSEFNPSKKEKVHLLQIWIQPNQKGLTPSYQQESFANHQQGLKLVVSPNGREGSLKIHQDAKVYLGRFEKPEEMTFPFDEKRHAWIQVTRGEIIVNGILLKKGDGTSMSDEKKMSIQAKETSEFLLFDLR